MSSSLFSNILVAGLLIGKELLSLIFTDPPSTSSASSTSPLPYGKDELVRGYTRRDGTYVRSYLRRRPTR